MNTKNLYLTCLYVTCLTLLPLSALAQHDKETPAGTSAASAAPQNNSAALTPAAAEDSTEASATGESAELSPAAGKNPLSAVSPRHDGAALEDLSPEVVKKLDSEQLESLIRHRASMQAKVLKEEPPMVAIMVPLFFFLCLGGIVGGSLLYRHRQNGHRHQTLRLMIEKGAEIPPELLSPPVKPRSDLRRGILLLAGGIGAMIFLALVSTGDSPQRLWSLGLIPSLVGVGYLVVWKLESKRDTAG